jgi:cytochrome c5
MRRWLVSAVLAFAVAALAAAPARAQPATALPSGDGREIMTAVCTQCHALTVILAMRDGPVGWKRHVYHMIMRGAPVTPHDADILLDYLNTNFGPGQRLPPANAIALPNGPGKDLVETRCTLCHDLERVTATKRTTSDWNGTVANMFARFGLDAPDEQRAIAAYLTSHFGRD